MLHSLAFSATTHSLIADRMKDAVTQAQMDMTLE